VELYNMARVNYLLISYFSIQLLSV
jgi:hypothetical protein